MRIQLQKRFVGIQVFSKHVYIYVGLQRVILYMVFTAALSLRLQFINRCLHIKATIEIMNWACFCLLHR